MEKFKILFRRLLKSFDYGWIFPGTRFFHFPKKVRFNQKTVSLIAPQQPGLAWDCINIFLDDEYGIEQLGFTPKTVIDVGANIGLFSLKCALHFPEINIVAFEPNPDLHYYYTQNLKNFNAQLQPYAVGLEDGYVQMEGHDAESRMGKTISSDYGIRQMAVATVLDGIPEMVDFMKMDCEGAEWEILQSPQLIRKVRVIRLEYHLINRSLTEFKTLVESTGFKIEKFIPNNGFGICWLKNPMVA